MKISSNSFNSNELIPAEYSCDGQNVNPQITISGVPKEAKSLALIVDDPDAPAGDWVHWVVWNIPSNTSEIKESSLPKGAVSGTNDFGKTGYGGPCPPSGTHHYHFKLYALDQTLDLPVTAEKVDLLNAMDGHILNSSELVGVYARLN